MLKTQSPIFLTSLGIFWLTLSGCVIHVGGGGISADSRGVSSIFGDMGVSEGKVVGDVSSVNGNIELENHVVAQNVDTVNGNIEVGDNVSVSEASTVNGNIETGTDFTSQGKVETVNGEISIAAMDKVEGDISTLNGDINLTKVTANGDVYTKNGDMNIEDNTVIQGNLIYEKKDRSRHNSKPTLTISKNSIVTGDIVLKRPVNLDIKNPELLAKVQYRYSDQ